MSAIIDVEVIGNGKVIKTHARGDKGPDKENKIVSIVIDTLATSGILTESDVNVLLSNTENIIIFNNFVHRLVKNQVGTLATRYYSCYNQDDQIISIIQVNMETREWVQIKKSMITDVEVTSDIVKSVISYTPASFSMYVDANNTLHYTFNANSLSTEDKTVLKDINIAK